MARRSIRRTDNLWSCFRKAAFADWTEKARSAEEKPKEEEEKQTQAVKKTVHPVSASSSPTTGILASKKSTGNKKGLGATKVSKNDFFADFDLDSGDEEESKEEEEEEEKQPQRYYSKGRLGYSEDDDRKSPSVSSK